jgi:hypothetical protein
MTNVHAHATCSTSRSNTGRSRRKTPAPITCSGCRGSNEGGYCCSCLSETRLHREAAPLLKRLVASVKGVSVSQSRVWMTAHSSVRQALDQLVQREEQRAREKAAYYAFVRGLHDEPNRKYSVSRDRDLLEHVLGVCRLRSASTLQEIADAFHRPVGYVRDLRDRCLMAMRRWPVEKRAVSTATRRAA